MVKPQDMYKTEEIEIKVVCTNNMFFVLYLLNGISLHAVCYRPYNHKFMFRLNMGCLLLTRVLIE